MRYLLLLLASLFAMGALQAQVRFKSDANVGIQPVWGPTGYDHVEFYYLPDIETYYSVSERRYYYQEGGHWTGRPHLPPRYHDFDIYHAYKVVVNDQMPYRNHERYRDLYASFKGRHDQEPIRDSHDERYFVNKNHPEHGKWMTQHQHDQGHGNGRGNGHGTGNGNGNGREKNHKE